MLELLRKFIRLLAKNIVLRKMLRVIAKKCIKNKYSKLNYAGWGLSGNIPLDDVISFYICTPEGTRIVYELCPEDSWVLSKLYWAEEHIFEKDTANLFYVLAKKAKTILDIGANFGYYTYLAAAANKNAKIMAFEPIASFAETIKNNARTNGFAKVQVFNLAISNKNSEVTFYINVKSPTMSTLNPENEQEPGKYSQVKVNSIRLDDLVKKENTGKIDLMKIDVEDHEMEAIEGMTAILNRDKPDVICEILPVDDLEKAAKRDKLQSIFQQHGYRWYWISPNGLTEETTIVGHKPFNANYLFSAKTQ